jgi:penicillin-binding protein 1A
MPEIDQSQTKADKYFPTYSFKDRDVLLIELEQASEIANSQTKMYGQMASILLAVIAIIIPLFFSKDNDSSATVVGTIQKYDILFSVICFLFGALLLRYFVDLQKQITINARKVVTLRVLLGLDYGSKHLTLPDWRVEGASNPFAIKYFNGWFNFKTSPFWVLTIGVNVMWSLSTWPLETMTFLTLFPNYWFIGNAIITLTYLYWFRRNLNDRHETTYLHIVKCVAWWLDVRLVPEFEYILYRTKLAYLELDRLKVDYTKMKPAIIAIEDVRFKRHKGVSYKSLLRAAFSRSKLIRKKYGYIGSGGSTVTMQLARTLFIPVSRKRIRRKIVEILMAHWLDRQFSKDEILNMYIASVQFDRGVLGLANAIKHFDIGKVQEKQLSSEEAFFLVERLSNNTSTVRRSRIISLILRLPMQVKKETIAGLYNSQIASGKLRLSPKDTLSGEAKLTL